ncbi:MAG TPA: hypothetical protein VLB44_06285, partial [Kofleriaceae bacterium]|nr:hypothetical protein [Kofleriaceae bacterium]
MYGIEVVPIDGPHLHGGQVEQPAFAPEHVRQLGMAQVQGRGRDGVEDRLGIGGRTADHAEDLAGRSLSVERLREVAIASGQFVEQAGVFDGDHRLVGERLQHRDLPVGERPELGASDADGADRSSVAQQRHGYGA